MGPIFLKGSWLRNQRRETSRAALSSQSSLPYTFGIASDLLSVTNTQRSLHIARLSDGASHDGNV